MHHSPTISIIMGIYNCADTLGEAIESIINQTYIDWELIMCDDGSQDNTLEVARYYMLQDPKRIRIIKNPMNMGLNKTLNKCLAEARGQYIARMDGDDVCDPTRLEKELKVLSEHIEFAIVSSDMLFFDERGVWGKTNVLELPQPKDFLLGTRFCHAACMVRKSAYDAVGGYTVSENLLRVEDYHLWCKMYAHGFRGINIKEPLYQMRDDRNATNRKKFKYRINEVYVKIQLIKMLKLPLWGYFYCLRPLLLGLLPNFIFDRLHKIKNS